MHGTLPAAAGWQRLVRKVSADIGLLSLSNCPFAFGQASRDLEMVVHGDDLLIAGSGDDFDGVISETGREARAGAESQIGSRV